MQGRGQEHDVRVTTMLPSLSQHESVNSHVHSHVEHRRVLCQMKSCDDAHIMLILNNTREEEVEVED